MDKEEARRLLELSCCYSEAEVSKAFKTKAKMLHPDKNPDKGGLMVLLNQAKDVLMKELEEKKNRGSAHCQHEELKRKFEKELQESERIRQSEERTKLEMEMEKERQESQRILCEEKEREARLQEEHKRKHKEKMEELEMKNRQLEERERECERRRVDEREGFFPHTPSHPSSYYAPDGLRFPYQSYSYESPPGRNIHQAHSSSNYPPHQPSSYGTAPSDRMHCHGYNALPRLCALIERINVLREQIRQLEAERDNVLSSVICMLERNGESPLRY